jgi:hypothetical protein
VYARMNTSRWNPEQREHGLKLTKDTIIPSYAKEPGYRGYILLLEPGGDTGIAITLWDSEDEREASRSVAQAMIGELRGVLQEPPVTVNYEVIAHFPD